MFSRAALALLQLSTLMLSASSSALPSYGTPKARIVGESQEYRPGSEVENLVLRPSGAALTVVYTFPEIYEVPAAVDGAAPRLVHRFEGTNGVSSIARSSEPDVYTVVTGNFSFMKLAPTPNSYAIHRLAFDRAGRAVVTRLAALDALSQPNGILHVPGTPYVLIADCRAGLVYRFDTETRRLDTYFDDALLKPRPTNGIVFGVNGLKFHRGWLYFSNTNQGLIARVKATGREARLSAQPEVVGTQTSADDFALDGATGDIWIAANGNESLQFVPGYDGRGPRGSTVAQTVLGGGNSTDLLTPTAAVWAKGREGRTLLVPVSGDIAQYVTGNFTGGSKVKVIEIS